MQAIKWAIQAQVDIISMSAALFKTEMDLEREIKEANSKGIVVISSMAGEGYNKTEAYPAIYPSVLGIAAANAQGKETLESVKADADYLFQGENIFTRVTYLGSENPQQAISGTSVATAIAAGVASLSLACHRLALSTKSNEEAWINHKTFREKIVRSVFDKMIEVPKSKYVTPWRVFPETEDKWSGGEATDVCKWIAEHFGNLL
jgi:Subtilase family